jgi:glycosyltransferase involved in cell wall biosynthesis
MRSLLAVSWEMPPMYGPRGTQVSRSLSALARLGWKATVVCLDPRRNGPHWRDGSPAEPLDDVALLRVRSLGDSLPIRIAQRVAPVLRQLPDAARFWVGAATRAAERAAAATSFQGLLTFAQPWSDHLVGLRVQRATGLPWVAHFSDPWVDSPYATGARWQRVMTERMESRVVAAAQALVFVTEETADLVMRKYPREWRAKASVVPHGFRSRAIGASASEERRPGPMRVVHTGRFYAGLRTPLALLRAIAKLNRERSLAGELEVILAGPETEPYARDADLMGVGAVVSCRSRISPEAAAVLAADADVLLVVDAPSEGASVFLPSKLVDYLAFRKPILGLTPATGASATLLRRLEAHVVPPDDIEAIASALGDLLRRWRAGQLHVSKSFAAVAADYDIRSTTAQLDRVLVRAFDSERS